MKKSTFTSKLADRFSNLIADGIEPLVAFMFGYTIVCTIAPVLIIPYTLIFLYTFKVITD